MCQPILKVENLQKKFYSEYDEIEAIKNVSFEVYKGDFISILGPSGCGKTTILSILSGVLEKTAGTIEKNSINKNLGYMFQNDTLFEWRTILENCCLPIEIKEKKSYHLKEKNQYIENIYELLKHFELWDFKDKYPKDLSGGMRQRVALIRSLAIKPDLLLLDEPFSALDYDIKLKLSKEIFENLKKFEKSAILVTHNIQEAISLSDKIIILSNRPSVVKKIINIDFGDDRDVSKVSNEPKFKDYYEEVWYEVMNNGN